MWRVYCRQKNTPLHLPSLSPRVLMWGSFLSFHLTQHLIHYSVIFSFNFSAFIFQISTFSQVPLFLCWCFHTVCMHNELDLCACVAHVSLSFDAARIWGISKLMKMGRFVLPCLNWTLLLLRLWLTDLWWDGDDVNNLYGDESYETHHNSGLVQEVKGDWPALTTITA